MVGGATVNIGTAQTTLEPHEPGLDKQHSFILRYLSRRSFLYRKTLPDLL